MIDLDFIERVIRALDNSGIDSLEIERGGTRVRLAKTPAVIPGPAVAVPAPAQAPPINAPAQTSIASEPPATTASAPEVAPSSTNLLEITSPMVGTFYRAPAPDAPPYVEVGSKVSPGDTLCVIEAMKLMNELECEISGAIAEVCIEDAQPVEFGQVLFRVDPS